MSGGHRFGSSFESQPKPGGKHFESQTRRDSCNATETRSAALLNHYQALQRHTPWLR